MSFLSSASLSPERYAAEILHIALGDEPGRPPGCLKIILACVDVLRDNIHAISAPCRCGVSACKDHLADEDQTSRLYPETFRRIMAFLAEPWGVSSEEDLAALGRRLWLCRCRAGPLARVCRERRFNELHDSIPAMSPSTGLGDLVTSMAEVVAAATEFARRWGSIYKVERNLKRAARRGTALSFPVTPLDLLPRGSVATIDALCMWLPLDSGARIMELVRIIIDVCRGEVMTAVVTCRLLQEDIKATVSRAAHLIRASGTLPHDDPISTDLLSAVHLLGALVLFIPHHEIAAFAGMGNNAETADACLDLLGAIAGLESPRMISALTTVSGRRYGAQQLPGLPLHHDGLPAACASDLDAALISEAESLVVVYDRFLTLSALVYTVGSQSRALPAQSRKACSTAIFAVSQRHQQLIGARQSYDDARRLLRLLDAAQRCGSPECQNTFASTIRKFARCSGCCRIPYCSVKCQRQASRHRSLPHRAVCRYIRLVNEMELCSPIDHDQLSVRGSPSRWKLLCTHLEELASRR